ncbi:MULTISPECIES: helix-turn-helix transcriptional regulator [Klebsiella]|uniref:helix-turn-helix transcriptional regulator n=1 Tax=Klebsiella TaxID=570 RepID=UPI000C29FC83|nr:MULTISPECIES: AlpA family phage regulatory protein [Klebsiella]PJX30459.1 hypothetical protein CWM53_20750 [Klebsiella sp. A-Nf5]PJX39791.1 hypothetical protein CWM59_02665 [Klebsiella sp. B-Nf7]PJX50540.1 hypothetical protein CWM60_01720 [Klebsiella sp. C1-16S-Nf17]
MSGTVSFVYFFRHSGRQPECRAMTTLSNSTRWRMEQEGKFPKRIKIGPSAVAYRLSEVQVWIRGEWVSL